MGELLQSIAFTSRSYNNIGVLNTDMSKYDEMDHYNNTPFDKDLFVDHEEISTGYLEDVLFEFTSKRRRLLMFSPDHQHEAKNLDNNNSIENSWTSDFIQNYCEDFDNLSHMTKCDRISDMESGEETNDSSSDHNQWTPDNKENLYCVDPPIFNSGANERRKKRQLAKVVYPFALVKPGGFEGDDTLNDINERILMPPTRAVRHPVGDFACRPLVSPVGPGLSGKAVVAFTRIHTQGRGTITIIRTRG